MMLDVSQYYQTKGDYSCSPVCIRMVMDYYFKKENREMTASEWLSVLDITMENDIWREKGTKKEDITLALETLKFSTKEIKGSNYDGKIASIRKAIAKKHPVIIYCVIKPKKRYRHFAVVVAVDDKSIYVRDPYPRRPKTEEPRKISLRAFSAQTPATGDLSWGRTQWGIEVIKKAM